jgi:hypothetical protein
MAYHGELVRMENGRWARFQECLVYKGDSAPSGLPLLVAVELDERFQDLLNRSEEAQALYRGYAAPVRLEAMPEKDGRLNFTFGTSARQ